jgi:hypothetical protein
MREVESSCRDQRIVAQGWTTLLAVVTLMGISQVYQAAIVNNFSEFAHHPGSRGWGVISVAASTYALMAVLTQIFQAVWFRWVNASLLMVVTLYMMAHQLQHSLNGTVYGLTGAIDFTHHLVGIGMSYWAVRWARSGARASASAPQLAVGAAAQ